jgi:hypothetical protein
MFRWNEKAQNVQPGMLVESWDGSFLAVRKVVVEVRVRILAGEKLSPQDANVRVFFTHGTSQSFSFDTEVATLHGV